MVESSDEVSAFSVEQWPMDKDDEDIDEEDGEDDR